MAIQWMDDFTSYGTDIPTNATRLLNGPYGTNVHADLQADPDPTAGGKMVLRNYGGGLGGELRRVLSSPQTVVGVAARYWLSSLPLSTGFAECPRYAQFKDVNNYVHIEVTVNPSGYIEVYRTDDTAPNNRTSTLLGTSQNPVLVTNAWMHVETLAVFNSGTSGSVQVRVNGIQVVNITGVRTTNSYASATPTCSLFAFCACTDSSGPSLYCKDFILYDGTGTVNNTFFGSCQVYKLQPASDVSRNWGTQQAATPSVNTPTTSTTGGTLAAATYYYVVTAIYATGETIASNEVSIATSGTTSSNTITWTAPVGMTVTGYRVYRGTATGAENVYYAPGNVLTFTDTGGASTAGTPPADTGTGWDKINDTTPDDDTKFITAGSSPIPSPYQGTLTQLPANVTSVRGVMVMHRSRKVDGGDGSLQASLISGANTANGVSRPITTAYTYWWDTFDQDPSGVNWNKTLVNALNLKLNRTV